MLIGRETTTSPSIGADLILPRIPWVPSALKRAQDNQLDFGFGSIPVLTVEDVIVAKCYALHHAVSRPKDLDDLQSILEAEHALDLVYIRTQLVNLNIRFSKSRHRHFPESVWQMLGVS